MRELLVFIFVIFYVCLGAQDRTMGLINRQQEVDNALKLYTSVNDAHTYLINSCGEVINQWVGTGSRKLVSYLMDNGNLVSAIILNDGSYARPGKTGRLEIVSWDNELLWRIDFTGEQPFGLHHDIEVLPNGNILMLLWDRMSREEAIDMGRDSLNIMGDLWPETIYEVRPVYPDTFDLIWEWHLRDHLIQDFDASKQNYGSIAEHPELVDINHLTTFEDDWIHANSLSYDEDRDEVILSSRGFNEVWVIDHSASTSQSRGHEGGRSGKGGDLLFRFGNAASHGIASEQALDGQHDARIISSTSESVIFSVFNNNDSDPDRYSEVVIFEAVLDSAGGYSLSMDNVHTTRDSVFRFNDGGTFDSPFMSSFERLPNGHSVVCSSIQGLLLEYNADLEEIWRYVSPINLFGIAQQGDTTTGAVFKLIRYLESDPLLTGLDLSVQQRSVETGNSSFLCDQLTSLKDYLVPVSDVIAHYLNPVAEELQISFNEYGDYRILLYDAYGNLKEQFTYTGTDLRHPISGPSGLHILIVEDPRNKVATILKVIKIE